MSVRILLLMMVLHASGALAAEADPLQSVMWEYHHKGLLNSEPYVFDDRVKVQVPPFAEDSRQVPVHIDARALGDEVVRIEAWADLNPIPRIFTFTPGEQVVPLVAIRIRVEQATPIRAAVLAPRLLLAMAPATRPRAPALPWVAWTCWSIRQYSSPCRMTSPASARRAGIAAP